MNIIEEFNKERDIPYRIPLSATEADNCCSGKTRRLKHILENSGYPTRYRVCKFKWSQLDLPTELTDIPHEDDCTHAYLEVLLDNEWVILDPTWDTKLKHMFNFNEWDGRSNTEIAVESLETYSPEESLQIMEDEDTTEIERDLTINGEFYKEYNNWLESVRC
jgi:hypothetical protein